MLIAIRGEFPESVGSGMFCNSAALLSSLKTWVPELYHPGGPRDRRDPAPETLTLKPYECL